MFKANFFLTTPYLLLGFVVPLFYFRNVDFCERIIDEFFSEHDDGQLDAKIVETGA